MSFASGVKQELCKIELTRRNEAVAESYGVLFCCNTFSKEEIRIVTESKDFAERLPRLFRRAFSVPFDEEPTADAAGKMVFLIQNRQNLQKIFAAFGGGDGIALHVNFGILEEDGERLAFLRGVFFAGGSVTDPAKRYHLELTTAHVQAGREIMALLMDMDFSPKQTMRGGNSVLYFKQSEAIEDFLTAIGARVAAMRVMEAKVEKDLRNGVNRRVNCETANLTKVVDASMEQIAAIRALEARGELQDLAPKLRETARLRQENPEATLSELAELFDPPVSKSAVNHRLRKLVELSGKAHGEVGE